MKYELITIDEFVSDWLDETGHEGHFEEDKVIKFGQDEAERLMRGSSAKEFITLIHIEDYRGKLPSHFQRELQAAYNVFPQKCPPRSEIVQYTKDTFDGTGCELKLTKECPKCKESGCRCDVIVAEVDVSRVWQNNHPEQVAKYWRHFYSYTNLTDYPGDRRCNYHPQFRLMYPKMGNMWNIQYNLSQCVHLTADQEISYLIDRPNIVVNFQEGQILLNYLGYPVDDFGKTMVPNDPDVINSIVLYIEYKLSRADYRRTRSREDLQYYQMTADEYHRAHEKAKLKLTALSISPIEFSQTWRNIMMKTDFHNNRPNLYRRIDERKGRYGYPDRMI